MANGVISPRRSSARGEGSAFGARHFTAVWISGMLWNLTRWGVAFLGTYLINEMTGSPRLVQLAGTTLYAPLLLGGVLGGLVSDRFDRLWTVRIQLLTLIPLSAGVGFMVQADRANVWLVYGYMFLVGIGWVTDMTSRRALVYDIVGQHRLDHAMAMESISLSVGMVLGALVGGSAIEAIGIGPAFYVIAAMLTAAVASLATVSATGRTKPAEKATTGRRAIGNAITEIGEGFAAVSTNRGLLGLLGVTVIANFFLFAYFPIVPVVADRLQAAPALVGLLSAGTGIGMMIGSLLFAMAAPRRRGAIHVVGLFLALAFIIPFARADQYGFALAAIIASGFGSGLFAATQITLVMAAAPDAIRGRALGLLSMAIGALPVGMYALGEFAERTGVKNAISVTAFCGLVVLFAWTVFRREVVAMVHEDSADGEAQTSDLPVRQIT